ncbi:aspartate aminotransferase family protein [Ascidiimonas aurantiaca]|uniref:aspartate aminotransferase family protein n=1 Tax=Ascidiimonas aurantiaca TaxID=1685432 RepID=UPI0030EB5189
MKKDFFKYQAQTSPHPLGMEISHAHGSYIFDKAQKPYLDMVAGISACSLGHCHPAVVDAVKQQTEKYLHVMVYGEYIQSPAVNFTRLLASFLPQPLETTYLTNSGTEATEGALKLAKRITGRYEIIAARNAYHGNTQGAMSVMGYETRKQAYRPLIPGTRFIQFNHEPDIDKITSRTAAVILETIQGGAGFITPTEGYLKKVKEQCKKVGALLILDEIQPGFGRTGKLFGFEHYEVVPDILVMGKGMGGGMPVGAFTASHEHMSTLKEAPKLGHITTFGGHPVIAAACLATLKIITSGNFMQDVLEKERLLRQLLIHRHIKEIRGKGLMLALILPNAEMANYLVTEALKKELLLFWLLFEPKAVRITPPLTISKEELKKGCTIILEILDQYQETHVN